MLYLLLFILLCVAVLAYVVNCQRRDIHVYAVEASKALLTASSVDSKLVGVKKRVDMLSNKSNSIDIACAGVAGDYTELRKRVEALEKQLAQSAVIPVQGAVVQKPKIAKGKTAKTQSAKPNDK
jgi:hypothetical protein